MPAVHTGPVVPRLGIRHAALSPPVDQAERARHANSACKGRSRARTEFGALFKRSIRRGRSPCEERPVRSWVNLPLARATILPIPPAAMIIRGGFCCRSITGRRSCTTRASNLGRTAAEHPHCRPRLGARARFCPPPAPIRSTPIARAAPRTSCRFKRAEAR